MQNASHFCDLTFVFLLLARQSLYKYHFVLARSSVLREIIPPFGVSHDFLSADACNSENLIIFLDLIPKILKNIWIVSNF